MKARNLARKRFQSGAIIKNYVRSSGFENRISILSQSRKRILKLKVEKTDSAKKYLSQDNDVAKILNLVIKKIPDYFDSETLLVDFIEHPTEGSSLLRINVICNEPIEESLKKLWLFDDKWWLEFNSPGKDKVSVDVIARD